MKAVKDFDEREKKMYHKYRSQTLSIVISEIFVAVIAKSVLQLNTLEVQIGLLILIAIPVIFYQIKMAKICTIEKEDIFTNFLLSIVWSIYFFYNNKSIDIICFVALLPWGLAFYSCYVWYKQKKDNKF